MSDIQARVEETLDTLYAEGSRNYAIFTVDPYYVQIAVDRGAETGYLEAARGSFLPEELKPSQREKLRGLGYNPPEESNWYQEVDVSSSPARRQATRLLLETLQSVYGVDPEDAQIDLQLDAW